VNNRGAVIGGFVRKQRASGFVWSPENGFVDLEAPPDAEQKEEGGWLTGCVPLSINDFGAILGWRVNGKTALQWNLRGKLVAELEGDFVALKKITNAGHVLWWTKLPGFVSSSRVSRDGVEEVLPLVEGACDAEACDINNLGEIIGEARVPTRLTERLPCLWTSEGEAHNLNTLISEREVIVDRPRAINDAGWIACQGAYRGRYGVPFVLEPGE
jgi:hypothetical protein